VEHLLAVVRNDGFARAAEVLHLSQPAISYTIAKIEERLGISILRQKGGAPASPHSASCCWRTSNR
jgi:DNA-binding transcriptional LysR family regulator